MNSSLEAVIFDMDGVIVDSEPRHERAFLEVVAQLGYGQTHGIRFADYIGRSDHELWVDFMARHDPPHTMQQLLALKRERVIEIIRRERPLFAGLPQLVQRLAPRYRLALASGSERAVIDEVLKLEHLGRFFAATVSASEVKQGKPAPDIFLRAADLVGVPPENCCVIEDSRPGIAAARAAGMSVVAIANTHKPPELLDATHVVTTYREIEEFLLGKESGAGG